jgi:hypothetical protein
MTGVHTEKGDMPMPERRTKMARPARHARRDERPSRRRPDDPRKPGDAAMLADAAVAGLGSNAITTREWSGAIFGAKPDLAALLTAVREGAERVNSGDLGALEGLLTAQVVALNAVFTELTCMAQTTHLVDHLDRYLRLALKAQAQCRATVEAIAAVKNPPMLIARQANIAAGPQQVNNGFPPAEIHESVRSELMEAARERMDIGPSITATNRDSAMAAVGTLHRPAKS